MLTDVKLAGVDGVELAAHRQEHVSGSRVIVTSASRSGQALPEGAKFWSKAMGASRRDPRS